MDLAATENSLNQLDTIESDEPNAFPVEFTSKSSSSLTRCMSADGRPFLFKSGTPHEIQFIAPVFVSQIEIEFSQSVTGAALELQLQAPLEIRNVRRRVSQNVFSEKIVFKVNSIISGLAIILQPGLFEFWGRRSLDVKRLQINGFDADDFVRIAENLTEIQGLRESAIEELSTAKRDLIARNDKLKQRELAVDELECKKGEELAELDTQISDAEKRYNEVSEGLTKVQGLVAASDARKQANVESISVLEATVRSIEGEIAKGKEDLRVIAVETSEKERRLHELTSNVNLFSEEFSSFSNHGAKQARIFIALSVVPLAIIAALTLQLLLGAVDLSVKYIKQPNLDLLTVFVTRLPYLVVCGSILAVCYSAQRFLFNRISQIFAERLDFSKIGILAKDVASASAAGLNLTAGHLYEERTYLKIQMIKSYLSGNIGSFTYAKRKSPDNEPGELKNPDTLPHVAESSHPAEP